jgi:hypothetical protein
MAESDRNAIVVELNGGGTRHLARGQNFFVERIDGVPGDSLTLDSEHEIILLVIEAVITIDTAGESVGVDRRNVVILPAGVHEISFAAAGRVYVLATHRNDLSTSRAVNHAQYALPDERVAPIGEPFGSVRDGIIVMSIDQVPCPPGNSRIKFIQSSTMSINWVEYAGPRDRTQLTPHKHDDFEQGSLAIEGDFVHHIRTEWSKNADHWREDGHYAAGSETLLIVPPEIIHTTEGVGDGHHILVDIFAPPRRDFIERGFMHNAADYLDPMLAQVAS